jgi:uncharacterized surface protein with fasciclin (FAS1) repeats
MMELITRESMKNVVETAHAAGNFTKLVVLIEAARLGPYLAERGPFTVFAPTDQAFNSLPPGTFEALLRDPGRVELVLTNHLVRGELRAADVGNFRELNAASGRKLRIARDEHGLAVSGSRLLLGDILTSDGIIHVVDAVILP